MDRITKESILALADSLQVEKLALPRGLGNVYVRELTGDERDSLEQWREANAGDLTGLRARIIASSLCTPEGEDISFTESETHRFLGRIPASVADEIVSVVSKLSGLVEPEGNENGEPSDNSGSGSQSSSGAASENVSDELPAESSANGLPTPSDSDCLIP